MRRRYAAPRNGAVKDRTSPRNVCSKAVRAPSDTNPGPGGPYDSGDRSLSQAEAAARTQTEGRPDAPVARRAIGVARRALRDPSPGRRERASADRKSVV